MVFLIALGTGDFYPEYPVMAIVPGSLQAFIHEVYFYLIIRMTWGPLAWPRKVQICVPYMEQVLIRTWFLHSLRKAWKGKSVRLAWVQKLGSLLLF